MANEISITVQDKTKGVPPQQILAAVNALSEIHLYVGIPEKNAENGKAMNNVQLAYLHSQGSPVNNMPARPFIEPAIEQEKVLEKITDCFGQAFEAALTGDLGLAKNCIEKAGIYGSNAVKEYMGSGALAPNAPITVSGGWMRNKVSGKPFKVTGKGSTAPLIDTGSLRSAVTYVIKEGGE